MRSVCPLAVALAVVGGGAGGVELALALAHRLKQERAAAAAAAGGGGAAAGGAPGEDVVKLFCRGRLLPDHPAAARAALRSLCIAAGVQLHEGTAVQRVEAGCIVTEDGVSHPFDEALWCTQAAAAGWLKATGLPTDAAGFLLIGDTLQSAGGPPEVFAAGDVASSVNHPRPKAGVYAVRQGPPLADNLRRYLTGQPLLPFVPQSQALALISSGDKYAVGTRGWLTSQGAWAWSLKDYIDRAFMDKYGAALPFDKVMAMGASHQSSSSSSSLLGWLFGGSAGSSSSQQQLPGAFAAAGSEGAELFTASAMRCGGCGAKVGSSTLSRVLTRVKTQQQRQQQQKLVAAPSLAAAAAGEDGLLRQLQLGADDAAVLPPPPPGHLLVSTVDFFRAFWPDAYLLGKIAANHALGDCYAMGATPSSALALAVVPFGPSHFQEAELGDMLQGAVEVLGAAGCELVGGHSSEGPELSAGFAITGHVKPQELLSKSSLQPGQALILTKALGTGSILAAAMRGEAKGRWVSSCLDAMAASSAEAARVLRQHGCSAATDVTGFGLLGHAVEMARASQVKLELSLPDVPALPGAAECISAGLLSSLHPTNAKAAAAVIDNYQQLQAEALHPLLFDPQTAGGLLAGVDADAAGACVQSLRKAGYADACVVGRVLHRLQLPEEGQEEQQLQPLVSVSVG
uniref:Selenide, water dikinase n=1 Tax=Tetradesmus obliquus TaxID=3088 RepID=A0A383W2K1_TETOB